MINESIFREYDIRGLAETELADPVVERIAMATAAITSRKRGSPWEPGSLVRSRTATLLTLAGIAESRAWGEKGR